MAKKDKEKTDHEAEAAAHESVTDGNRTDGDGRNEQMTADTQQDNARPADETKETAKTPSCEERFAELNEKYIRLYSDFDNFRKRSMKEKADIITMASADVIKDLLVILDDFERAVTNNEKVEDPSTLREGFRLIQHKLLNTLQQKGLEPIESKGEVFDADKHEAITNIAVEDEAQKGKVIDVIERGYNLRGKTIRYAKVIVGQ